MRKQWQSTVTSSNFCTFFFFSLNKSWVSLDTKGTQGRSFHIQNSLLSSMLEPLGSCHPGPAHNHSPWISGALLLPTAWRQYPISFMPPRQLPMPSRACNQGNPPIPYPAATKAMPPFPSCHHFPYIPSSACHQGNPSADLLSPDLACAAWNPPLSLPAVFFLFKEAQLLLLQSLKRSVWQSH